MRRLYPKHDDRPHLAVLTLSKQGWVPEDIAVALGISESTVYARLKRAKQILDAAHQLRTPA